MKRSLSVLVIILFAFLSVTVRVFAGTPAQKFPVPDIAVSAVNPCNNLLVTVTWTNLTLLTRNGEDANGRSHILCTHWKVQSELRPVSQMVNSC
jgi:hypothetical protein